MLDFETGGSAMNKLRLLTTLLAAAALGGCATYDYAGGSAPGGYYYGRAASSYGPYYDGYGYPSYGYGGYGGYGYGYGGYYNPYYGYGGYYPYYPHRPHHPRPPRPEQPGTDRAPASRDPSDGRYRETGQVMIPPRSRVPMPSQPQPVGAARPAVNNPGVRQRPQGPAPTAAPRQVQPSAPRIERPSPARVERAAPVSRPSTRERSRTDEN